MAQSIFHLAFPVNNASKTKVFYVKGLGCSLGRESKTAIILGLNGHQLVAHIIRETIEPQKGIYPRHFGLIFKLEKEWKALAKRAKEKSLKFYTQPRQRFPGTPLEHQTFILEDPFSNLLEFKYYKLQSAIFGEHDFPKVGDTEKID